MIKNFDLVIHNKTVSQCKMQISEYVYMKDFLKYRLFIGSYTNYRINRKYRRSGMPAS